MGVFLEVIDEPIGVTFEKTMDNVVGMLTVLSLEFNREDERLELLMCMEVIGNSVVIGILTDTRGSVEVTLDFDKVGCDVVI